jgi:hypothetical protein
MRYLIIILASWISFLSNANANENKVWCIEQGSYFRYGPYFNIKDCSEIDYKLVEITEAFYNRLKGQTSGFETVNLHNKKIFEMEYNSMVYELVRQKNHRQEIMNANQKKILAEIEAKKLARKIELDKYTKQCEGSTFKKGFKKGTAEFDKCLVDEQKKASLEQTRIANLTPSERYAYTCEKTYGFRKGSEPFKECVFKIMTTEYEMQAQINQRRIAELESRISGMERSTSASNTYNSEMLEIERMKAKAMQDQVNFARNKDITDTLLGISNNLLNPPRRPAPNAPQMFNCQTRKFGGFDQIQCF